MKFAIPEAIIADGKFQTGDLYAAGNNSSDTAYWLVVAITHRGGAQVLELYQHCTDLQRQIREAEGDEYDPIPLIFGDGFWIDPGLE